MLLDTSQHLVLQVPELVHELLVFILGTGHRACSFIGASILSTVTIQVLAVVAEENLTLLLGLSSL